MLKPHDNAPGGSTGDIWRKATKGCCTVTKGRPQAWLMMWGYEGRRCVFARSTMVLWRLWAYVCGRDEEVPAAWWIWWM